MAGLLIYNQKLYCVGFEVLTARLLTIKGFWYVTPHRMHTYTYIYTFHSSLRLSPDNRMWNMSKTYKSIQDI